jgi:hypothetical protein
VQGGARPRLQGVQDLPFLQVRQLLLLLLLLLFRSKFFLSS